MCRFTSHGPESPIMFVLGKRQNRVENTPLIKRKLEHNGDHKVIFKIEGCSKVGWCSILFGEFPSLRTHFGVISHCMGTLGVQVVDLLTRRLSGQQAIDLTSCGDVLVCLLFAGGAFWVFFREAKGKSTIWGLNLEASPQRKSNHVMSQTREGPAGESKHTVMVKPTAEKGSVRASCLREGSSGKQGGGGEGVCSSMVAGARVRMDS